MARCMITCAYAFALIVLVSSQRNARNYDDDDIRRGNEFIDKLLHHMFQERGEEYEPYHVEDSQVGFNKKVLFVNVSGEAKLHNGYITGLDTLHRPNDCSLKEENGKLKVKADLGAGVLTLHYDGSVKFMNFGPTISIEGIVSYVEVYMEFDVNAETGREGELIKFVIDDMRGMKITVSGLGPLNWAVNPIISGVTKIFKRFVKNFFERKVRGHIADYLPDFQFPVDGVLETTSETTISAEESSTIAITEEFFTEDESSESEISTVEKPVTTEDIFETDEDSLGVEETSDPMVVTEEEISEEKVSQEDLYDPQSMEPSNLKRKFSNIQ